MEVHHHIWDCWCQYTVLLAEWRAVLLADGRFVLQAPIVFWYHRSSHQQSAAVLSQSLAQNQETWDLWYIFMDHCVQTYKPGKVNSSVKDSHWSDDHWRAERLSV